MSATMGTNSEAVYTSLTTARWGPNPLFSCGSARKRRGARRGSAAVGFPMIRLASDEVCQITLTNVMHCSVLARHV